MTKPKIWVLFTCVGALLGTQRLCAVASFTEDATNPYSVIVAGNAFRLNPPPPPPPPDQPPPPDLPTVIFSGTVTIGNETKALFAVKTKEPKGAGKGAPSEDTQYMSLKEGDTEGVVQLLKIEPGGEEVDIMNSGTKVVLNLKDNGFEKTVPAGGGMRGAPGAPIMPAGVPGQPGQALAFAGGGVNVGGGGAERGGGAGGGVMIGGGGGGGGGGNVGFRGGNIQGNPQANLAAAAQALAQPNITPVSAGGSKILTGGAPQTVSPISQPNAIALPPPNIPTVQQPNNTAPGNSQTIPRLATVGRESCPPCLHCRVELGANNNGRWREMA